MPRARPGCHLNTLFGNVESVELKVIPTASPKKRGMLPILTILFLISYGLMTLLVTEQAQTIESQRALIRELFRDSAELSAVKMKAQAERNQAARALEQNPSSQTPSTQAPATHAPSTQVEPQHHTQIPVKPKFEMPSKPASDLADKARTLITI